MVTLLAVTVFLIAFTVVSVMADIDKTLILIIDVLLGVILHLVIDHFIAKKEKENNT